MKKVMMVGAVGAGKTTLLQALQGKETEKAAKTQMIRYDSGMIDTPGEYAQSPRFYSALQVTAMDAAVILLIQDATKLSVSVPPGFAGLFSCPVIGVVTKVDHPAADQQTATVRLQAAGIKEILFFVSAMTGEGLGELHTYLAERGCNHE
ncbi:EutP/PduV family microcompartment system protein [Heliobacillus mobilis]|uniref:Ethanolamine utilization protein eutP n=1 Tax=Heliobacterium mobile TaxID=28064 RepID=Q0PIC4_HELMO|nr:EutP/PduV family microcompartment system protein [Heliobacterium mobile]ABH04893.1 ethanolamine utilization protein eutP [Heliobacterium mobile]MTV47998.1 EutP/PduV family microcompartment system protein [Heliobacterium mobile]